MLPTPLAYKYVMTVAMIAFVNHYASRLNLPFDVPLQVSKIQRLGFTPPECDKIMTLYDGGMQISNYSVGFTDGFLNSKYAHFTGLFVITKLEDDGMNSFGIPLLHPHESSVSIMERASRMKYTVNTNDLYRIATNYLMALDIDQKSIETKNTLAIDQRSFHSNRGLVPSPLMCVYWGKPALRDPGSTRPLFPDDPKGLNLPPSVPRLVDTNGNVVWLDHNFTTPQYRQTAFQMVLEEANHVAKELQLPGEYPLSASNLVEAVVTPFGFNYVNKTVGSVTSSNYCYYVSRGNKFSYLEGTHQTEDCYKLSGLYTWPVSRINTNEAYQLATQWLTAVSMDVKGLNRDCHVTVEVDEFFGHQITGKFVPIYDVTWMRKGHEMSNDMTPMFNSTVASVRVATPTRKLLQLRVEDPQYILRKPLIFANLNSLLPGKAAVYVEPPPQRGGRVGP